MIVSVVWSEGSVYTQAIAQRPQVTRVSVPATLIWVWNAVMNVSNLMKFGRRIWFNPKSCKPSHSLNAILIIILMTLHLFEIDSYINNE